MGMINIGWSVAQAGDETSNGQPSVKRLLVIKLRYLGDVVLSTPVLPAYSPELNPDEYLNGDLKAGVHGKPPARDTATLKKNIRLHMRMLQHSPGRVSKYFNHPKIAYAA